MRLRTVRLPEGVQSVVPQLLDPGAGFRWGQTPERILAYFSMRPLLLRGQRAEIAAKLAIQRRLRHNRTTQQFQQFELQILDELQR